MIAAGTTSRRRRGTPAAPSARGPRLRTPTCRRLLLLVLAALALAPVRGPRRGRAGAARAASRRATSQPARRREALQRADGHPLGAHEPARRHPREAVDGLQGDRQAALEHGGRAARGLPRARVARSTTTDEVWLKIRIPRRPNGARAGCARSSSPTSRSSRRTSPSTATKLRATLRKGGKVDLALADRRRRAGHAHARRAGSGSASGCATSAGAPSTARGRSARPPTRTLSDWPGGGVVGHPRHQPAGADPRPPLARLRPRAERADLAARADHAGRDAGPHQVSAARRRSAAAALGSLAFLGVAPGVVAGLVPYLLTGWERDGAVSTAARRPRLAAGRGRARRAPAVVRPLRAAGPRHARAGRADGASRRHRPLPPRAQPDVPRGRRAHRRPGAHPRPPGAPALRRAVRRARCSPSCAATRSRRSRGSSARSTRRTAARCRAGGRACGLAARAASPIRPHLRRPRG